MADDDADDAADDAALNAAPARRPSLFRMPNWRADIAAFPDMFRTRKLLWLPVLMLVIGFVLMYLIYAAILPDFMISWAQLYIQFFFLPYGLFTFFLGGFLAPRASYLVGLVLGLLDGVLWTILIFIGSSIPSTGTDTAPVPTDPAGDALRVFVIAVVYGTLAAAFAAWYRDFLRGMQERSRARRAEQEAKDRVKRREERRTARRPAG